MGLTKRHQCNIPIDRDRYTIEIKKRFNNQGEKVIINYFHYTLLGSDNSCIDN